MFFRITYWPEAIILIWFSRDYHGNLFRSCFLLISCSKDTFYLLSGQEVIEFFLITLIIGFWCKFWGMETPGTFSGIFPTLITGLIEFDLMIENFKSAFYSNSPICVTKWADSIKTFNKIFECFIRKLAIAFLSDGEGCFEYPKTNFQDQLTNN